MSVLKQALVIARRDFLAVVATPTFLIFLLAPLLMIGFGLASGSGAAHMATQTADKTRIVALADANTGARLLKGDASLRRMYREEEAPPKLMVVAPTADVAAQVNALFDNKDQDVTAVMYGPLAAPHIAVQSPSERHARYLAALAEADLRAQKFGLGPDAALSKPVITNISTAAPSQRGKQASGFGAVFGIFFLTLLLAGQAVGMLAEEKSNKVIEILAAAVPLEAVFFGKLLGMFGVSMLFIGFWAVIAGIGLSFVADAGLIASFAPAIGLPTFLILCACYFTTAFMLLGAVFLGVGAQASTMREIQMMSLPITLVQVGMFGLSTAAAGSPDSSLATFAQVFPLSSPFAMAARGATDAALWPHLLALAWQILWVGIVIWLSVRLFRIGVLKSGNAVSRFFDKLAGAGR